MDCFGPRFIALSDAYDLELRRMAHLAWKELPKDANQKMSMHEGVYAFVGGPKYVLWGGERAQRLLIYSSYETRAECRMLSMLGADLVGMSTVPEVIIARHCGIRILAMSLVTNNSVLKPGPRGDDPGLAQVNGINLLEQLSHGKADHEEVLAVGHAAAQKIKVGK